MNGGQIDQRQSRFVRLLAAFTADGHENDIAFGLGWDVCENNARWALGMFSEIVIRPVPVGRDAPTRMLGVLHATPYLGMNSLAEPRISVAVNDAVMREASLPRAGTIAFWIDPAALQAGASIRFGHPDAICPAAVGESADGRSLAFAFHKLEIWEIPHSPRPLPALPSTYPLSPDIMDKFESLGDNCEFGVVQRLAGKEPLALLRFAATPYTSLISGLINRFDGMGDESFGKLDVRGDKREYILTERRYNLTYHTFVSEEDFPPDVAMQREMKKLTLLKRRMLDDLGAARRIYVIKRNINLADEDVIALYILLRSFGPNRLLFVKTAEPGHPAGSLMELLPGLLCGYIGGFAPYDRAAEVSFNEWIALCNAAEYTLRPPAS